jgi:hypothetical protein
VESVKEAAFSCYRHGWFTMSTLRESLYRLVEAVYVRPKARRDGSQELSAMR